MLTSEVLRSKVPLVAIASSRLGHDVRLHWHVCQFLRRSVIDCKRLGGELLVGAGTAIEPWAERAAELMGVRCRRLAVSQERASADVVIKSCGDPVACSVDAAVITLADRVDVAYVRRRGRIVSSLHRRLKSDDDASIRVAVMPTAKCAARELIAAGAVGWWNMGMDALQSEASPSLSSRCSLVIGNQPNDAWARCEDEWLVHCTRGRVGRWPSETERQYRDSMLLGDVSNARRGPLDALLRIVRSGRITASAIVSNQGNPVVCFSALSLERLLLCRCFRPHLGRWDYEPFGIAIRRAAAMKQGVQPVIYGTSGQRVCLPEQDRFRFHPRGKTYDWSREREWRSPRSIDLASFDIGDVRVFAVNSQAARVGLKESRWHVSFVDTVDWNGSSV